MVEADHELSVLLSLDGYEFDFASGYRVRFEARRTEPTLGRPHGVRYSLTLHDPAGRRIYGIDNAHAARRGRHSITGTGMGGGGSSPTPTAARSSWWTISTAKWSGFCATGVCYEAEGSDV